jgi:hypothetical protein
MFLTRELSQFSELGKKKTNGASFRPEQGFGSRAGRGVALKKADQSGPQP